MSGKTGAVVFLRPAGAILGILTLCLLPLRCGNDSGPAPEPDSPTNLAADFEYEPPNEEDIVEYPATGELIVRDRIAIRTNEGVPRSYLDSLIVTFSGRLVCHFDDLGLFVVKIPSSTNRDSLLSSLNEEQELAFAIPAPVGSRSQNRAPRHGLRSKEEQALHPSDALAIQDLFGSWTLVRGPLAWSLTTGSSQVMLAIIDTGMDLDHPDLASRIGGTAWYPTPVYSSADDACGHGTTVAGIAAAAAGSADAEGIVGANWGSVVLPAKAVLPGQCDVHGLYEIAALNALAEFRLKTGAKIVVSMSFGGGVFQGLFESAAIHKALGAGLVLVAAADNAGQEISKKEPSLQDVGGDLVLVYPASFPGVIAVGAVNTDDAAGMVSNYGNEVLAAPGHWWEMASMGGGYTEPEDTWTRTSWAAPVVCGLAGLVWSMAPQASGQQVVQMILDSADRDFRGENEFGLGRVNFHRAVRLASGISLPEDKLPASIDSETHVRVTTRPHELSLEWDPVTTSADGSPATDIAGYNIYSFAFEGSSSSPVGFTRLNGSVVTDTTFTASNLQPGETYYFAVIPVDQRGQEATAWVYQSDLARGVPGGDGANTAPTASFTVDPSSGTTSTTFHVDASGSSDTQDPTSSLQVRWDWENDGIWDTSYSTTKTNLHQYPSTGTKTIKLEVKDTGELTGSTTRAVTVRDGGPAPGSMVLVPAGTFTMGDGVAHCGVDQRQVTLTHGFYLGQYEVTTQEYRDAVQWAYDQGYVTVPSTIVYDNLDGSSALLVGLGCPSCISFSEGTFVVDAGKENHPMVEVSWYGAAAYCDWVSLQAGLPRAYNHSTWQCNGGDPYGAQGYRLPTDAEWEYAAQYEDERIYPWGNEAPDCSRANYSPYPAPDCVGWTSPVGSYPAAPAALDLYDMAGNAWEWCNDRWQCELGTTPAADPPGPAIGPSRVRRGGSWYYFDFGSGSLRCANRNIGHPSSASYGTGFRCVRSQ